MLSLFATSFRRRLLPLVALSPLLAPAARAQAPSLVFEGTKYVLAAVQTGAEAVVTNIYVPEGSTFAAAASLIRVRQWPKYDRVRTVANDWLDSIAPRMVQPMVTIKDSDPNGRADTFLFEIWLSTADPAVTEISLCRFLVERGARGTKDYAFIERVPTGRPAAYTSRRGDHLRALSALRVKIVAK
jgi:hypothetical protein